MNSIILVIPIVAIAVYSIYRHVKKQTVGGRSGTCCDCPSHKNCTMNASKFSNTSGKNL